MLRLPTFEVETPTSVEDLVTALQTPGAQVVAGGTDLLPNLKHHLQTPPKLVRIDRVAALKEVTWDGEEVGTLRIGAAVTLADLANDERIKERFPSFAHAAGVVASPLLRNMATIGGNVNLDTRCRYVNQTEFWRSAIGGCLKSEGNVCHVVPKGRSCVAAMSSDCVPVLISLGARLALVGPDGLREVALKDYYTTDGTRHTQRRDGEVTTEILIPWSTKPVRASYTKWTVRKSIDFPLVSIAMHFVLKEDNVTSEIVDATICLGVLAAKPKLLRTSAIVGMSLSDPQTAKKVGELCEAQGKTVDNVPYEAAYRRRMLAVYGRRAVEALGAA